MSVRVRTDARMCARRGWDVLRRRPGSWSALALAWAVTAMWAAGVLPIHGYAIPIGLFLLLGAILPVSQALVHRLVSGSRDESTVGPLRLAHGWLVSLLTLLWMSLVCTATVFALVAILQQVVAAVLFATSRAVAATRGSTGFALQSLGIVFAIFAIPVVPIWIGWSLAPLLGSTRAIGLPEALRTSWRVLNGSKFRLLSVVWPAYTAIAGLQLFAWVIAPRHAVSPAIRTLVSVALAVIVGVLVPWAISVGIVAFADLEQRRSAERQAAWFSSGKKASEPTI